MRIRIVTLNFNGSKETLELLKSLENQSDNDFKIIIIDNASEEADFANLKNELIHSFSLTTSNVVNPQIMRNGKNLGFSGGCNVGIRQALGWNKTVDPAKSLQRSDSGASWVVLLNNDVWVEKGFIECLRAILMAKTGIVSMPLIEGDQTVCCGRLQWLKSTLIHIPTFNVGNVGSSKVYAIGGAMAINREVFEKIGLLDEKYFLYFEDADFSVRARKAGFDISIAKNLSVHHHVSSSTKKLGSSLLLRYNYRNALYFNLKNGPWYIKLAVWPWSWLIIIKQIIKIALGINPDQSEAILKGVVDFYQHKFGKLSSI